MHVANAGCKKNPHRISQWQCNVSAVGSGYAPEIPEIGGSGENQDFNQDPSVEKVSWTGKGKKTCDCFKECGDAHDCDSSKYAVMAKTCHLNITVPLLVIFQRAV